MKVNKFSLTSGKKNSYFTYILILKLLREKHSIQYIMASRENRVAAKNFNSERRKEIKQITQRMPYTNTM